MADKQPQTRKAYRQAQKQAEQSAATRDKQRVRAERDYAKQQRKARRGKPQADGGLDAVSYQRVTGLKKKLNWAIGIVIVLLIAVALILFLV